MVYVHRTHIKSKGFPNLVPIGALAEERGVRGYRSRLCLGHGISQLVRFYFSWPLAVGLKCYKTISLSYMILK